MLKYTIFTSVILILFVVLLITTSIYVRYRYLDHTCSNGIPVVCYNDWTCPTVSLDDTSISVTTSIAKVCYTSGATGGLYNCLFNPTNSIIATYLQTFQTGTNICSTLGNCTYDATTNNYSCTGINPNNCLLGCPTDLTAFMDEFSISSSNNVCNIKLTS